MTSRPFVEHVLRSARAAALIVVVHGGGAAPSLAQDAETPPGWTNETELSLALTGGNSTARTFGFGDTLRLIRESSRLQVRVTGIRSGTAGDPFLLVNPGLRFPIAGTPENPETRLVEPGVDTEVENYLASGRYEMEFSERFFWNAGGSWDRNSDAGILNRYTAFAGVGNVWSDSETMRFATSYAASYTNRTEEAADPGKDPRFAGARLGWDYRQRLGAATVYENELTANVNLTAASDYSFNMAHTLSVALSTHLALRVGLQWLYEHEPAPEQVAVVARVTVVDPDGVPGSGDELFETVADGGAAIGVGASRIRKDRLDTIFRTALVISF